MKKWTGRGEDDDDRLVKTSIRKDRARVKTLERRWSCEVRRVWIRVLVGEEEEEEDGILCEWERRWRERVESFNSLKVVEGMAMVGSGGGWGG